MVKKNHERTCILSYSEKRKFKSVCAVDVSQAKTVIALCEQPRPLRLECGWKLSQCLEQLRKAGRLGPDEAINVNYTNRSGIVVAVRKPLYWRVADFVMCACASKNEEALKFLCDQLLLFIAGSEVRYIHPWIASEFKKPIVVPDVPE